MKQQISQSNLILKYYKDHPNQDIPHSKAVDWATQEWNKRTGKILRDPDRAVRKMAQQGLLIKVNKGVYKYDPDYEIRRELQDFSPAQKEAILKRDNYRCVVCGRGIKEGVELQVDHRKPKELDGEATIDNGQVLCAQHNFQKKTYGQTEFGKRLFMKLKQSAITEKDENMIRFCDAVLDAYNKFNIDNQI